MKKFCCILVLCLLLNGGAQAMSAQSGALYDCLTGKFLYEKDADNLMLFASTTKIMTALVALELYDPLTQVTIAPQWTGVEGSSIYLKPNEIVTVQELLYGLLLKSGNDAAVALAGLYTGNVADFVTLMNAKAIEIGANSTFFENPNGLDSQNHKTTAKDLALITAEGLKNPEFVKITSTKSAKIGSRVFTNHNKLLTTQKDAIGVKTGYTKAAGRCLVSAVDRGGRIFVAVTLKATDDWADHRWMYDTYAPETTMISVIDNAFALSVPVTGGAQTQVAVVAARQVALPLCPNEIPRVVLTGSRFVYGGIARGEKYGEAQIYIGERLITRVDLLYDQSIAPVEEKGIIWKIIQWIIGNGYKK